MLSIDQQANRWAVRLSEHGLDEAERASLDAWCAQDVRHHGAFLRALAIQRAAEKALRQGETGVPAALQPTISDLAAPPQQPASPAACAQQPDHSERAAPPPRAPRLSRRGAVIGLGGLAAGLAVWVGVGLYQAHPLGTTFQTATGEFRSVPLADQSTAHINSASELAVVMTESSRLVHLNKGEAWFDVAKDKSRPFVVDAGEARVRAVGTSFAVVRQDQGADVLVTEGVVEVWHDKARGEKHVVVAGEHAHIDGPGKGVQVRKEPAEVARRLAWRKGELVFDKQTLAQAVAEFNRYSPRQLVVLDPQLQGKALLGRYRINDPETFARDIGALYRAPVAVTQDRIYIGDTRMLQRGSKPGRQSI
jgi:transmembrane sensor